MRVCMFKIFPPLILSISILFTTVWSTDVSAQNSITFVIDGLDRSQNEKGTPLILPSTERGYLKDSQLVSKLPTEFSGKVVSIPWSGNVRDGVDVDNAVALLQTAVRNVPVGTRINIVGHSFGSVIAYKALENLGTKGPPIENFVTLSSPLGEAFFPNANKAVHAIDIPTKLKTPAELNIKPGRWINRYAEGDSLGGKITVDGVNNKPVTNSTETKVNPHSLTYSDPVVAQEIITGISTGNYQGVLYDKSQDFRDASAATRRISLFTTYIGGEPSGVAKELLQGYETSRTKNVLDQMFAPETTPVVPSNLLQITPRVPHALSEVRQLLDQTGFQDSVGFENPFSATVGNTITIDQIIKSQTTASPQNVLAPCVPPAVTGCILPVAF